MRRAYFVIWISLFLACQGQEASDLSYLEKQILIANFVQDYERIIDAIQYFDLLGAGATKALGICENLKSEVLLEGGFNEGRKGLTQYLQDHLGLNHNVQPDLADSLRERLKDFSSSSGSLIQDMDFVNKAMEFIYWQHWACTSFELDCRAYYGIDTLYVMGDHDVQLDFTSSAMPDFRLLSNSLQQDGRPSILNIPTPNQSARVAQVNYQYLGQHLLTGENRVFQDSIMLKRVD